MTESRYQEEIARIAAIDRRALAWDADGCRELALAIRQGREPDREPVAVTWLDGANPPIAALRPL